MVKGKKTLKLAQLELDIKNLNFKILEYKPNGQKSLFIHNKCKKEFETKLSHLIDRNR